MPQTGPGVFGPPLILVGEFEDDENDPRTWCTYNDSIGANGNRQSYIMRAMRNNVGPYLACINTGRIGGVADSVLATYGTLYQKFCSGALFEYHTNNMTLQDLAWLQAKDAACIAAIRAAAVPSLKGSVFKVGRTELGPRTTGTFADTAGQTVSAKWGAGEQAEQYGDWALSQVGIGGFDFYAAASAAVRAGADRSDPNWYKWIGGYTGDGLHPGSTGSDAWGDALRVLLPA